MPTLVDVVNELKKAGYGNDQIISYLQQQGFKPKEILDAINQAKLTEQAPQEKVEKDGEMQPSIMEEMPAPQPQGPETLPQEMLTPQSEAQAPQQLEANPPAPMPTPSIQQQIMPQAPFTQEMPETIQMQQGYDVETIEALTEEIINEKWELLKRKIGNIEDLRKNFEKKIIEFEDRLKRVELNLDKIHLLILEKQEKQAKEIKAVGKEINMLETAFKKILNPLSENIKKLEEISKELKGK